MHHGQRSSCLTGRLLSGSGRFLIGRRRPGKTGGSRAGIGLLLSPLVTLALLASAAPASASQLLYFGGPVVHSTNVVLVEWGPDVRASYANPSSGDPAFFQYLSSQDGATSDIGGVLAQYMDTTRHNSANHFNYLGAVQINPSVAPTPPGKVLDAQVQTVLENQIKGGVLPAPSGNGLTTLYVVLFPPGDNVCFDSSSCAYGNGGFCAYHGSFKMSGTPTQVLYTAQVDNGPGTPNDGGCGGNATDLGNQTSVVSHEVAETINDPLNQVASWYDYNFNGEIADKCDAQPLASNGPWTVERLWSNRDARCEAAEPAYSAPTASFLASSSGTAGQPVSFSAASSTDPAANRTSALDQPTGVSYSIASGIVGYRWNWGDGSAATTSTTPTAHHTFAQSGNYEVSLTVTDALGFTSTKTQEIGITGGAPGAPVVSTGTASGVSDQGATLNGTINPEGQSVTYHFAYGTDPNSLTQTTGDTPGLTGQTVTPVSAALGGLTASTRYYYELIGSAGGNSYLGGVKSFRTTSASPPPTQPLVATGAAQTVSASGARLTGTINPEGLTVSYYFRYGTTSLNHTTAVTEGLTGQTAVPVNASITGLSHGTTYHYELVATAGSTPYVGAERKFTTVLPLSNVITGAATNITDNSAVATGMIDPRGVRTIYQAQFGRTTQYGYSTTWITGGSGNSFEHVSLVLFGLRPNTTYHYRLVAQNRHGTTVGADRRFTTAPAQQAAPNFHLTVAPHVSLSSLLSRGLATGLNCSRDCIVHVMLAAQPSGTARADVLPMWLARAQARLARAGSGRATLTLPSKFHSRLRQAWPRPSRLVLMGYATAPGGAASPPQRAVIQLSG
jgi:PKD repeat protein